MVNASDDASEFQDLKGNKHVTIVNPYMTADLNRNKADFVGWAKSSRYSIFDYTVIKKYLKSRSWSTLYYINKFNSGKKAMEDNFFHNCHQI